MLSVRQKGRRKTGIVSEMEGPERYCNRRQVIYPPLHRATLEITRSGKTDDADADTRATPIRKRWIFASQSLCMQYYKLNPIIYVEDISTLYLDHRHYFNSLFFPQIYGRLTDVATYTSASEDGLSLAITSPGSRTSSMGFWNLPPLPYNRQPFFLYFAETSLLTSTHT
jgi:hypothetical protein